MKNLHQKGAIDDKLLLHTAGITQVDAKKSGNAGITSKNGTYQKVTGTWAKYFMVNDPAYAYPLFKTHKVKPDHLSNTNIYDIPVRLLQSAGNIATSRVTAFIESVLNPISKKYCSMSVDEFCKDSKSYLELLSNWKSKYPGNCEQRELYIVAADVQSLYPSVKRCLVRDGIKQALSLCSNYSTAVINMFVELTMYCLNNVIVQNDNNFYNFH